MNRITIIIILLLIAIFPVALHAGDNPFVSERTAEEEVKSIHYPVFVQKILQIIAPIQHKLSNKLTALSKEIKKTNSRKAYLFIIFISFLYGVIHAIGPGHGKTITFSYFLSRQANIMKGVITGSFIAFLHALSAIIVVMGLYLIIKQSFLVTFENLRETVALTSYGFIALIGLFLSVRALSSLRKKNNSTASDRVYDYADNKSIFPVVVAVGIVPCPGAVIILLFSVGMGQLELGILLTVVMALGMAATISSVGVTAIFARQGILNLASRGNKLRNILQRSINIAGSLLILCLGIILFLINIF